MSTDLTMALLRACAQNNHMTIGVDRGASEGDRYAEVEIAIGRVPTKRYGELEDVKLTADACPSCLSHRIDDFDTSERGDNRPHRHCWACGRVWLKEV